MSSFPSPTSVTSTADVRAFFDDLARHPKDRHGPRRALLRHRLRILDSHAHFTSSDVVLDVGCGDGAHLHALADHIHRGIGIDLSPSMIARARRTSAHPHIGYRVDNAEVLSTIPSSSVDKVICVGVLEHVLRPARALQQIARVLKSTGRLVALTLNGAYWWYRLADQLDLPSRHLTTDERFDPRRGRRLLRKTGFSPDVGFWRFVPSGDLPQPLSLLCHALDALGRRAAPAQLRGGLRLVGHHP